MAHCRVEWYRAKFLRHLRLAGHKFAQKWTLFGVVVFVQHYATNRFLVGGTGSCA